MDLRSKVNAINLEFIQKLGFKVRNTNVSAQKIDDTILKTSKIVISTFSFSNKDNRERFFKETFLLADISPYIVLAMAFLTINNADVKF